MLRVIQAFGDHLVGDSVTDPDTVAAVLATDQAAFVVPVPEPEPEPASKAAKPTTSAS